MIKISAVSYLNTFPFIYGLENSSCLHDFIIEKDVPAICAEKLLKDKVDIGLIPVAVIPQIKTAEIITDYCIGAISKVKTVLLLSNQPLNKISKIYLDIESRTSVQLVKVLAQNYWIINPKWEKLSSNFNHKLNDDEAVVLIGDKTFNITEHYAYVFDLASEWNNFTGLPFVFAAWVANKKLSKTFLVDLNEALKFGIRHINETISFFNERIPKNVDAKSYFTDNISYQLDDAKRMGMELFFKYLKVLNK
ncbi:MAG: menaquinone biosynthesis protein [Bacteroidetes bacterium]|nr:menaquinone biosynthesis protein [Bacteroidota bacterium]